MCAPLPPGKEGYFFFITRYAPKRMIPPPVANNRLPMLNPVTCPKPRKEPTKPPTKAPAIPIRMVTKIPPGSFPGIMNFASTPTISPMTIQDRIPIVFSSFVDFTFNFIIERRYSIRPNS
ncbi:hypothetical protein H206_05137 [Candidatus Electrothrix aarhusensis]|uniref:Uncharacterized protein n=1 Tax=Candidatus Electrothrix aarhusensis TaxID=1859131 RepID=A0A444J5E8_9BACT|nr:hypothetical protein H206_05137 [Candidatus Electrothrix aarhusensis]